MHHERTIVRGPVVAGDEPPGTPEGLGPPVPAVPLVAALVALGAGVVVLAALAAHAGGVPVDVLFRDATVAAKIPREGGAGYYAGSPYAGVVIVLTIVVWGSVASLPVFVAWLWRDGVAALAAGLTALMGADGALMLHEQVGPAVGVPDLAWPAVYGVVAAVLLWCLARERARGPLTALLAGLVLLALSLGIDVLDEAVLHLTAGWLIVAEDGFKLLGAMAWLALPVLLHAHRARPRR